MLTSKKLKTASRLILDLLSIAAATPLVAYAHGAGNGGDELELTNSDVPGDVNVPVPSDMSKSGTLELVGTLADEQKNSFVVASCDRHDGLVPARFGCHKLSTEAHVNASMSLMPGLYSVNFQGMGAMVDIKAGEKTVIELKKLSIGSSDHELDYIVFEDLTDTEMQDRMLLSIWAEEANRERSSCSAWSWITDRATCEVKENAANYRDYKDVVVQFNEDGSWSQWLPGHSFYKMGRNYVTIRKSGGFVSVLPGTYGIKFTDPVTGKTETTYGIRVE